ncbi:MAG: M14 family zinc carboxypeptidase [Bdellovibrionota bacterium]
MIHLASWKKTALGTPIALYASAPLEQLLGAKPLLLMGGIHGDEPEGVRLAEDTLQWLKSHTSEGKNDTRVCPWILIPCLNVDGFAKRTRVNGRGVDLNRNYPSRDWSAEARAERYFPGTGPASEPEIQAVVELIQAHRPRLVIHCHSWKPCIVGTGALSKRDSARLAKSSGYDDVDEIGYPTPGSLSRYAWHDHEIPVICIEEQEELKDLSSIWPRFSEGMKSIFEDLSLRDAEDER